MSAGWVRAAALVSLVVLALSLPGLAPVLGGLAVAALALRAWQESDRTSWLLLAAGAAAATAGLLPVPDDVAHGCALAWACLTVAGLLSRPGGAVRDGGAQAAIDALMVGGSLFSVSWVLALGPAHREGQELLALGVPLGQVLVLTAVIVVLARSSSRRGLGLLSAGLALPVLTAHATAALSPSSGSTAARLLEPGWALAAVLLVAAAVQAPGTQVSARRGPSRALLLLPYGPVVVGIGIAASRLPPQFDDPSLFVGRLLIPLLVLRQLLTLVDNRRLVQSVMQAQEQLRYQAFHDSLTSLANRALFLDRLEHAVALHRRTLRATAVLLLDLDDFKAVNDSLGHAAGDHLLQAVAERLRAATRRGDTVARLGGDEFAVLTEDDADPLMLAERVLAALQQPVAVEGRMVQVRASIGVAVLSADSAPVEPSALLKQADIAMYAAKHSGKDTAVVFGPELRGIPAPRAVPPVQPAPR